MKGPKACLIFLRNGNVVEEFKCVRDVDILCVFVCHVVLRKYKYYNGLFDLEAYGIRSLLWEEKI